jgi:hypothetical protein
MSDVATHSNALASELHLASRDDRIGRLGGERSVGGGLALLVALAALSGIVDVPGSQALLATLVACLALATAIITARGRSSHPMPVKPVAAALVLVGLAGSWIIVQLSPIAPASWQHPLWALSAPALGDAARSLVPRIGLDPDAAGGAIIALLRDALAFWIAYGLAATTAGARRLLTTVAIIGVLAALAMLVIGLAIAPLAAVAATSGAGVVGLGMVALLAVWVERRSRAGEAPAAVRASIVNRTVLVQAAPLVGVAVLAGAIAATDGLGGLLVSLIGLFGVLLAVLVAPGLGQFRRRAGIGLSLGSAFIAGALLVGVPIAIHWLAASAPDGNGTGAIAAQAIADAPLIGSGAGTSAAILRLYGAAGAAPGAYLAAMIELGIPAVLALVLGCAALFWLAALGVWRRRRNVVYACTGIGATLLVASDAVAGPSLRDPAVALVWCVLMGIACAQALRSDERRGATA